MKDGSLSPKEQSVIDSWNAHGVEVTDSAMKHFLVPWFTNIRRLIKADFPMHSIGELRETFALKKNFVILGSGPSAMQVLESLPRRADTAVFCGPTCVGAMLVAGFTPDLLIIADSNVDQFTTLKNLELENAGDWKIVLPITADSSWYGPDSPFKRDNLYFYLSYIDAMGTVDIAYNDIQHVLFPDVHQWIKQAGSVGNAMISFTEMLCGEDLSKRIFLSLDCCSWLSEPPLHRAFGAERHSDGKYYPIITPMQKQQILEDSADSLYIPTPTFELQTNLTSLGYAIQMLYLVHWNTRVPGKENRYALLSESSRLFLALQGSETIPVVKASEVGIDDLPPPLSSPEWAYNVMIKVMVLSNEHKQKLIAEAQELVDTTTTKEAPHVQERIESPLAMRLAEAAKRCYRRVFQR